MKKKVRITMNGKTKEVVLSVRGETPPPMKVVLDKKSKEKHRRVKKVTYHEDDGEQY